MAGMTGMTVDGNESGLVLDRQPYRHGMRMGGQPAAREPQVGMGDNADRVSEMADQAALLIVFLVQ